MSSYIDLFHKIADPSSILTLSEMQGRLPTVAAAANNNGESFFIEKNRKPIAALIPRGYFKNIRTQYLKSAYFRISPGKAIEFAENEEEKITLITGEQKLEIAEVIPAKLYEDFLQSAIGETLESKSDKPRIVRLAELVCSKPKTRARSPRQELCFVAPNVNYD